MTRHSSFEVRRSILRASVSKVHYFDIKIKLQSDFSILLIFVFLVRLTCFLLIET